MSGKETPEHLNTMYTHINTHHMLLLLLTTHVGSARASFKHLVTVAQENTTNQTATASFELGNSFPGVGYPQREYN